VFQKPGSGSADLFSTKSAGEWRRSLGHFTGMLQPLPVELVSIVMGVPQASIGWFISWKIPVKWMMAGGTLISGNFHLLAMWLN
jgi:hypothetical protein